MILGKLIVWLIVGALAGTLASRLMTFSKEGYGLWFNLGIGMIGAVVGGGLFWVLGIDFKLGELKITFEDLISAIIGSFICIVAWKFIRMKVGSKKASP